MKTITFNIVLARAALSALISTPGFPGVDVLNAAHDELLRQQRECPQSEVDEAVASISPSRDEWEIA